MEKLTNYVVDWLAFSKDVVNSKTGIDDKLIHALGYDLRDFEEATPRFFYNSAMTLGRYVNVYWNSPDKPLNKNASETMTIVFTGQGCTSLAEKWNLDWLGLLSFLKSKGVNFTRIDLALDDFDGLVDFNKLEDKLTKGHYRSSRRSFNVVRTSDADQSELGRTIYIGNARAKSGSRGNAYARFYDKRAQYESKHQLPAGWIRDHWAATGQQVWQRYELSFSKSYAVQIIDEYLKLKDIDLVFKGSLRNMLEVLDPVGSDSNKRRWTKTQWWEDFLKYDNRIKFQFGDKDVSLGELLDWIRISVLPSLKLLELIGDEKGFDIYQILRDAEFPEEFSKKQLRVLEKSNDISLSELFGYLKKFKKNNMR